MGHFEVKPEHLVIRQHTFLWRVLTKKLKL
jgi:hypothetical protein